MKTCSLEIAFHSSDVGDGAITLTLEVAPDNTRYVNGVFSFQSVRWQVSAPFFHVMAHDLQSFAGDIRKLAESLDGSARLASDQDEMVLLFRVGDRDAGKIAVSGQVYTPSWDEEFKDLADKSLAQWTWGAPHPPDGCRFLFHDLWVDASDLPGIADQVEKSILELDVPVKLPEEA